MDIQLLADLLRPPAADGEDDEPDKGGPSPYANPGAIAAQSGAGGGGADSEPVRSGEIWRKEEIGEGAQHEYDDPREQPHYEIVYKQAVSTEDVFFGMGNKTPTTAGCEDIVVRIHLQGVPYKDVDLVVTDTFLDCTSPQYRLGLHLPHHVDPDRGAAKWFSKEEVLEVTLRLVRPLDDLNQ